MAVKIRLSRVGAKNKPSYRIVVCDESKKRNGKTLEILGFYSPLTEPATVQIKREQFDSWIKKGAQPSDTVKRLILGEKRLKPKHGPKKEKEEKKVTIKEERVETKDTEEVKETKEVKEEVIEEPKEEVKKTKEIEETKASEETKEPEKVNETEEKKETANE